MRRFFTLLGAFLVLVGAFGISYTWHADHRTAEHLSARCRVDFQTSRTETGKLEGAVLTVWDYRYDRAKLTGNVVLYTDGSPWEMTAQTKQTPADFSGGSHRFKNENKLFVELPRSSLGAIRKAEEIRFRFYYDNGDRFDLPLSAQDIEYWRRQVEP